MKNTYNSVKKKKVIILIIPIISRVSLQRHRMVESDQSQEWKSNVGHDPLALAVLTYCKQVVQLFNSHCPLLPKEGAEGAAPRGSIKL